MQNRATQRNALRKQNYELPCVSNDTQSSETLRNSLGLNYKPAAPPLYAICAVVCALSFSDKFGHPNCVILRDSCKVFIFTERS
jgi:hypothetical protein